MVAYAGREAVCSTRDEIEKKTKMKYPFTDTIDP